MMLEIKITLIYNFSLKDRVRNCYSAFTLAKGNKMSKLFNHYQSRYWRSTEEEYSLQEYLDLCKADRGLR